MAEFSAGQERWLKQLISSKRCTVCRRSFNRDRVRLAARHEQLWIISVRCAYCRNQQMYYVDPRSVREESLLQDMTQDEEEHFARLAPVSSDDILDMHLFLDDFNGDFKRLFRR